MEASLDDIAGLYRDLAPALAQRVRSGVQTSEPVIEDACQFAWGRLVVNAERVREEKALPWLTRTAVREARRLTLRQYRDAPLDELLEDGRDGSRAPELDELFELRERLGSMRDCLTRRQQMLLWLHGLGLNYGEMASYTGHTQRTVERQVLRARRRMRRAGADAE